MADPQSETEAAAFDPNLSPSHLLHRAAQISADLHLQAFGKAGLTQRQIAVLATLGSGDGLSQTDLVNKTGIDRSTLAEMVARMEVKGLVLRTKLDSDARVNTVILSDEGRNALTAAVPKLADIDRALLDPLPSGARIRLVSLLTNIALPAYEGGSEPKIKKKKDKKKKERKKKKA